MWFGWKTGLNPFYRCRRDERNHSMQFSHKWFICLYVILHNQPDVLTVVMTTWYDRSLILCDAPGRQHGSQYVNSQCLQHGGSNPRPKQFRVWRSISSPIYHNWVCMSLVLKKSICYGGKKYARIPTTVWHSFLKYACFNLLPGLDIQAYAVSIHSTMISNRYRLSWSPRKRMDIYPSYAHSFDFNIGSDSFVVFTWFDMVQWEHIRSQIVGHATISHRSDPQAFLHCLITISSSMSIGAWVFPYQ